MEISKYNSKGSVVISEEAVSSIATNAAKDVAAGTAKAAAGAIAAGARAFYNKATINFGRKDLAVVRDDFDKQFDKDFPNNRVLIKLYKTTVLLNQLRQQKSLTSEI